MRHNPSLKKKMINRVTVLKRKIQAIKIKVARLKTNRKKGRKVLEILKIVFGPSPDPLRNICKINGKYQLEDFSRSKSLCIL